MKVKKWGNSLGVVLPKDLVEKAKLKEGKSVRILVLPEKSQIKDTFGMIKKKKGHNAQKIKDQFRKELY